MWPVLTKPWSYSWSLSLCLSPLTLPKPSPFPELPNATCCHFFPLVHLVHLPISREMVLCFLFPRKIFFFLLSLKNHGKYGSRSRKKHSSATGEKWNSSLLCPPLQGQWKPMLCWQHDQVRMCPFRGQRQMWHAFPELLARGNGTSGFLTLDEAPKYPLWCEFPQPFCQVKV